MAEMKKSEEKEVKLVAPKEVAKKEKTLKVKGKVFMHLPNGGALIKGEESEISLADHEHLKAQFKEDIKHILE